MCCTAFQETRIPSETCARETDGKQAFLVIYVGEIRIPGDMCAENTHPWEIHITVTPKPVYMLK